MARIVLKISGEYLGGKKGFGFDEQVMESVTNQIVKVHDKNIEIIITMGGGNFFRGNKNISLIDRVAADNIGMLATVMNGLFLQSALEKKGKKTCLMSAIETKQVAETYIQKKAVRHLEKNRIVILSAGLGAPYFSTDTASVVRAKELGADMVIKGTKVDGVYDKDPVKHEDARKFQSLTYDEVLTQNLKIMDSTAITFSQENQVPLYVLNITSSTSLVDFFEGKNPGTSINQDQSKEKFESVSKKNKINS